MENLDLIFEAGCTNAHEDGCKCGGKAEFIHPACHLNGGLSARYSKGVIELSCLVCEEPVVAIRVASKPIKLVKNIEENDDNEHSERIEDIRSRSKKDPT